MQITQVQSTSRRDIRAFLRLPFDIYAGTPQWVPPLMPGERARFRNDYAFYSHSAAAFFLARDDAGRAIGRLAVLEHRPHNAYRNKRDALLYLYEAIDDDEVAAGLFEAAEGWARGRGLTRLVGPKGFLTGDGLGLLVEGFAHRPAIGIPYNPAYYVRHWEGVAGMVKEVDYLSAVLDRETFVLPERVRRIADKVRQRHGFHVPPFRTKAQIKRYADTIQKAYNQAFATVWAYTPIPDEELKAVVDKLMIIADPPLMKLIFKGEELAGFQFAYPDISAAIQHQKGRIWPLGWVDMLLEKRRTNWINVNGNAVLPKFQGMGANAVLYDEMMRALTETRYRYADLVQVQENNVRMLSDLAELMPVEVHKRHRVYTRRLD